MELRHLRYFVAVAERLHFGRAAADLGITQPSLSQQIQRLEDELQTVLLERTRRRVQLTEPGRLFLAQASEILAQVDRAAVTARRASVGEVGRLRVGLAHWIDPALVVPAIARLHAGHSAITVDLRSMPVPAQYAALESDRLDVGFVRSKSLAPLVQSELMTVEPFVVALPETHPLASRRVVPLTKLATELHVLVPRDLLPVFYDVALRLCRDAGFVPHVRDEADHPESVLGLVAAGAGVSLVPAWVRRSERPGLAFRPLEPSPLLLETRLAWRRHDVSPLPRGFLASVRASSAARAPIKE